MSSWLLTEDEIQRLVDEVWWEDIASIIAQAQLRKVVKQLACHDDGHSLHVPLVVWQKLCREAGK